MALNVMVFKFVLLQMGISTTAISFVCQHKRARSPYLADKGEISDVLASMKHRGCPLGLLVAVSEFTSSTTLITNAVDKYCLSCFSEKVGRCGFMLIFIPPPKPWKLTQDFSFGADGLLFSMSSIPMQRISFCMLEWCERFVLMKRELL